MLPVSIIVTGRQNMFSLLICYAFTRNHKIFKCTLLCYDGR